MLCPVKGFHKAGMRARVPQSSSRYLAEFAAREAREVGNMRTPSACLTPIAMNAALLEQLAFLAGA